MTKNPVTAKEREANDRTLALLAKSHPALVTNPVTTKEQESNDRIIAEIHARSEAADRLYRELVSIAPSKGRKRLGDWTADDWDAHAEWRASLAPNWTCVHCGRPQSRPKEKVGKRQERGTKNQ